MSTNKDKADWDAHNIDKSLSVKIIANIKKKNAQHLCYGV